MTFRVHRAAYDEARKAAQKYEQARPGLGDDFIAAVEEALSAIQADPVQFARLETNRSKQDFRRYLLKRFPYLVVFELMPDSCHVLAVAHGRRRSNYWEKRRKDKS